MQIRKRQQDYSKQLCLCNLYSPTETELALSPSLSHLSLSLSPLSFVQADANSQEDAFYASLPNAFSLFSLQHRGRRIELELVSFTFFSSFLFVYRARERVGGTTHTHTHEITQSSSLFPHDQISQTRLGKVGVNISTFSTKAERPHMTSSATFPSL
jgi:hypothetical protein